MLRWTGRYLLLRGKLEWGYSARRSVSSSSIHQAIEKHTPKRSKWYGPLPLGWQAVIGVEVHAQLKSAKKLFSPCPTEVEVEESQEGRENTLASALDAALPGSLPMLQEEPLRLALRTCLALECKIAERSSFDRKHYFYPDLTSGYQITQKHAPLAKDGTIRLMQDDGFLLDKGDEINVRVEQVQLEQDTAKSSHYTSHSSSSTLVDLNRAGCALVEIVSGPDMRTAEQAGAYVRKLREIVRRAGVSDGNMDQGSLRCDVNISVHQKGQPWGVRCEVKNLNSIRFVMNAVGFEIHRQYQILSTGKPVEQETRGYNEETATTYSLRSKEDSPDYRYMPDANLPSLHISREMVASVQAELPEQLEQQRKRLIEQYGIPLREVNILARIGLEEERGEVDAVAFFEEVAKARDAKVALNWVIQILLRHLNAQEKSFADNCLSARQLGELLDLVENGTCTMSIANSLIGELLQDKRTLQPYLSSASPIFDLLTTRDALALNSGAALASLCHAVIRDLPEESNKVRMGNQKVVMRLVGEVMKRSKGRADAQAARQELLHLLKQ